MRLKIGDFVAEHVVQFNTRSSANKSWYEPSLTLSSIFMALCGITRAYEEGLERHGLNVWRMISVNVACLALTHKIDTRGELGAVSIRKTVLPGMAIPMLKIRRPNGRLIFNMEITIRR